MIDTGVPLRSTNGAVNEMLHACFFCSIRKVLPLLNFTFCPNRPEILHAINTVDAANGALDRRRFFQISLYDFDASACQSLRCMTIRIASQRAQFPAPEKNVTNDRSTLSTGCSSYKHRLVRIDHACVPYSILLPTVPWDRDLLESPTSCPAEKPTKFNASRFLDPLSSEFN